MSTLVRNTIRGITAVAATLALAGCNLLGGGSAALGPVELDIKAVGASSGVSASSTTSQVINVTDNGGTTVGTITLTTARLSIEEVEFEHENNSGVEREVTITGARVIDLLAGTVTPAIGEVRAPEGRYVDIEIDLNESDDDDEPGETPAPDVPAGDPLRDYSVHVVGSYDPDGAGVTAARDFTLTANWDTDFELAPGGAANGFVVDLDQNNSIIVAFNLNDWFAGMSEELAAIGGGSGAITLDTATATTGSPEAAALSALATAIKASANFGEDLDGDDVLDADEDND